MGEKGDAYRRRILPEQLDRARRRLEQLEREAIRQGRPELIQPRKEP